jgi:tRNA-2-methylthio-N6-dimethylallyladenosine synthase
MNKEGLSGDKFFIVTFGCQMNVRDSERMAGFLLDGGMEEAVSEDDADLIIINTCSVRRKPEQKAFSLAGRMGSLKDKHPGVVLAMAGCVAQQVGEEFLQRFRHLDLVIGTQSFSRVSELYEAARKGSRVAATGWLDSSDPSVFSIPVKRPSKGPTAFVTIMQGCDNFCSYCIVPHVRGRERSRPADEILAEVESLAASGVKEVTLLGQNVNSYGKSRGPGGSNGCPGFHELLREVAGVDGIERVRFTTSHPKDLSDKLIEVMAEEGRVMEHIHLPVQAGSTRVLSAMNRGYTRGEYLERVQRLRESMPEISITTDLMVGFPGESEDEFQETLSLLDEVHYDEAFSFAYTPRPFTSAARLPGALPEGVIKDRLYRLQEKQNRITLERNRAQVGKELRVLVEGVSKRDSEKLTGRARGGRLVHFRAALSEVALGSQVKVRVMRELKHSLAGELIS